VEPASNHHHDFSSRLAHNHTHVIKSTQALAQAQTAREEARQAREAALAQREAALSGVRRKQAALQEAQVRTHAGALRFLTSGRLHTCTCGQQPLDPLTLMVQTPNSRKAPC
jgi:hypothetical protein